MTIHVLILLSASAAFALFLGWLLAPVIGDTWKRRR